MRTTASPTPGGVSRRQLAALLTGNGLKIERTTGAYAFLVPPAAIKTLLERDRTSSDLDHHRSGLGGVLAGTAHLERRLLQHVNLPWGLSVVAIGRRR